MSEPIPAAPGPVGGRRHSRRSLLRAGVLGLTGLNLIDLLRAKALAAAAGRPSPRELSVILAWLDGGRIRALAPHSQLRGDREYLAIFGAADERGEAC